VSAYVSAVIELIENYKHWDSAYLRQGTSYQCRHRANQYEQQICVRQPLSVSPSSDESGNNPRIETVIRIATEI